MSCSECRTNPDPAALRHWCLSLQIAGEPGLDADFPGEPAPCDCTGKHYH